MIKAPHIACLFAMLALSSWLSPAFAHKSSDAYLVLSVDGPRVYGQWDISLRDLDFVLGLDANDDGDITWGEVKRRQTEIDAYALARLDIASDGEPCSAAITDRLLDEHSDGGYSVLRLQADCAHEPRRISVGYRLFADTDPQHRGLLKLQSPLGVQSGIFGPRTAQQTFSLTKDGAWRQFADYLLSGTAHIWAGYDHILFLVSLLLPATLALGAGGWTPRENFRTASADILKIVTAFTIAHSVTLALAAFQIVSLPARLTESAIALSVALAACNNLYPVIKGERWLVAGCFGLIHGFGFANTLTELGLSDSALAVSLAGFNLGVETGQVAIVGAFLPFAWFLRRTWFYRKAIMVGGSYGIATIAALWLLERSLDMTILSIR